MSSRTEEMRDKILESFEGYRNDSVRFTGNFETPINSKEDYLAEAYECIYTKEEWKERGKDKPDNIEGLVFKTAINLYKDDLARKKLVYCELTGKEVSGSLPIDDVVTIKNIVQKGLSLLPPEYRKILEYRYFEEMTEEEIAKQSGIPRGTVKSRMNRGLHLLEEKINGKMG